MPSSSAKGQKYSESPGTRSSQPSNFPRSGSISSGSSYSTSASKITSAASRGGFASRTSAARPAPTTAAASDSR